MGAALVFGFHESRSLSACVGVAVLANLILGGVIIASALEGAICLVMALPIALLLAVLGEWWATHCNAGRADASMHPSC